MTLSASNGYTGTTLVSGGTLLLANTAALSGSTFDTSGSGSLSFGTLDQRSIRRIAGIRQSDADQQQLGGQPCP